MAGSHRSRFPVTDPFIPGVDPIRTGHDLVPRGSKDRIQAFQVAETTDGGKQMIEYVARFFAQGGAFMWVILAVLAGALAVILERLYFFLVVCRKSSRDVVGDVARALNAGKLDVALGVVSRGRAPLLVILRTAVARVRDGLSYAAVRQGVEEVAIQEVPRLSKRLNYLATFANVATLTGLLGTIFGLQQSFSSLGAAEAAQKAAMLASGISQAMNTTAFGLMVAIPCMVAYSVLSNLQAKLSEDVDASSTRMLNYLEALLPSNPAAGDGRREGNRS